MYANGRKLAIMSPRIFKFNLYDHTQGSSRTYNGVHIVTVTKKNYDRKICSTAKLSYGTENVSYNEKIHWFKVCHEALTENTIVRTQALSKLEKSKARKI